MTGTLQCEEYLQHVILITMYLDNNYAVLYKVDLLVLRATIYYYLWMEQYAISVAWNVRLVLTVSHVYI
jgi:hypothetical protein